MSTYTINLTDRAGRPVDALLRELYAQQTVEEHTNMSLNKTFRVPADLFEELKQGVEDLIGRKPSGAYLFRGIYIQVVENVQAVTLSIGQRFSSFE